MEFLVLGPLEARGRAGQVLSLGGTKQQALLAVLLLRANEVVSRDSLIDALWGEWPPRSALHSVEVYVSRLRKTVFLGDGGDEQRLLTRPPGYMLKLQADELDLHRFERLAADGKRAAAAGNAEVAATILAEALALWRGVPLPELAARPSHRRRSTASSRSTWRPWSSASMPISHLAGMSKSSASWRPWSQNTPCASPYVGS